MAIQKLDEFAEIGDKNLTGIDMQQGFIQAEKPARQWFNFLFNSITKKVNEVITAVEELVISTDKIADGAVTVAKLAPDFEVTGGMIAKDADLDTPKLTSTLAITTLDAPNLVLAADGTLRTTTRKAGILENDLVVRGSDGYPTNNNAIGVGQTWQDMTASRAMNTTYTNSTGRPLFVSLSAQLTNATGQGFFIDGVAVALQTHTTSVQGWAFNLIIPKGSTYKYVGSGLPKWMELR